MEMWESLSLGNKIGIIIIIITLVLLGVRARSAVGTVGSIKGKLSLPYITFPVAVAIFYFFIGFENEDWKVWATVLGIASLGFFWVWKDDPKKIKTLVYIALGLTIGLFILAVFIGVIGDVIRNTVGLPAIERGRGAGLPAVTDEVHTVTIDLLDLMNQEGHYGKIFLPQAKFSKIEILEDLAVRRGQIRGPKRAPLRLHFGARSTVVAKVRRHGRDITFPGFRDGTAIGMVVLEKGTVLEFSSRDDKMIWFSAGEDEELYILSPARFSYREVK